MKAAPLRLLALALSTCLFCEDVDATRAPPYWPRYAGDRHVELLDGLWNFSQVGSIEHPPTDFDSMDPSLDPSSVYTPNRTMVPSCVDATPPGYLGYRGVTFFRRWFDHNLTATRGARIQFQACSFYCRVWINGKEIGDHRAGGYVAFVLDVPPQNTTYNEIFLLVDNRFNETTAPLHLGGDFWHYGGIMRSVELHSMPERSIMWPWRLYILPESLSTVHLTLHLSSKLYSGPIDNISLTFDESQPRNASGIAVNGIVDLGTLPVPNPRVWSTVDPQLHIVQVKLNGAILIERFGLRVFGTDHQTSRLTLNGQVLKLVGWNHHTQWPETAASPTNEQLDADAILLVRGGANFVRGSHYPQDPRWLDRLDENGMIMWCETLGPAVSVKNTQDPTFLKYQAQQMNEMLDNAMNHASVGIWGFFNEGPSHSVDACPAYKASADIIHARDHTRFVTYASSKAMRDKCFASATLLAINAYPGWYDKEDPKPLWDYFANNLHAGNPPDAIGKPFIISETGAGGIFEWSDNVTAARWTLAYQTRVIAADVDTAIANPNISGIALWHFFDFKTDDPTQNNTHCEYLPGIYPPICGYINVSTTSFSRPGGENHKGSIDFWRREKPAYRVVAAKFNETKRTFAKQFASNLQREAKEKQAVDR
jgi:beta-glucuronidase